MPEISTKRQACEVLINMHVHFTGHKAEPPLLACTE